MCSAEDGLDRWADLKINFLIWDVLCNLACHREPSVYKKMLEHQSWMSVSRLEANVRKVVQKVTGLKEARQPKKADSGDQVGIVIGMQEFPTSGNRSQPAEGALREPLSMIP